MKKGIKQEGKEKGRTEGKEGSVKSITDVLYMKVVCKLNTVQIIEEIMTHIWCINYTRVIF